LSHKEMVSLVLKSSAIDTNIKQIISWGKLVNWETSRRRFQTEPSANNLHSTANI
jgi:hypothetical protein